MVESMALGFGLLAGLILGALAAGLWLATRLRSQFHVQLFGAAERAQRAEALAEELRRQEEADHLELDRLRRELHRDCRQLPRPGHDHARHRRRHPADAPGVMLSHNPRAFDRVDKARPLLILSGHTHAGQWHIPMLPPVAICLWHLHTRFVQGWYRGGALRMYVNRGVGVTGPRILAFRVNCPPEVALLRLVRSPRP